MRVNHAELSRVAACTFRGTPFSGYIECMARIVPSEGEPEAESALRRQYGLVRRLLSALVRDEHTYLELTPLTADKAVPEDEAQAAAIRTIRQTRHEHPPPGAA
jgi:hypothetical protein